MYHLLHHLIVVLSQPDPRTKIEFLSNVHFYVIVAARGIQFSKQKGAEENCSLAMRYCIDIAIQNIQVKSLK